MTGSVSGVGDGEAVGVAVIVGVKVAVKVGVGVGPFWIRMCVPVSCRISRTPVAALNTQPA